MTRAAAGGSLASDTAKSADGTRQRNAPPRAAAGKTVQPASSGREELSRVEEFLQSLARAVRQFHTYPAASPRCVEAVEECHRALALIDLDLLPCVVSPHELLVNGDAFGRGTLIEHELARRLSEARCHALEISRGATARDVAHLCTELAARLENNVRPLGERLHNRGVERIQVSAAYEPQMLDVSAPAPLCASVELNRQRSQATHGAGRVTHLYPADKGWVRVDPGVPTRGVTLSGLAVLVEDPASLAQMLSKLVSSPGEPLLAPGDALEERCEDVARLYTSLDPAVARARFAKLASTVLSLEPTQRRRLLSNSVLPALVDGRPEGELLRDFSDVDLADALSLLLDVETAAPELLSTALDRLQLSPARRETVGPLLEERIRARHGADAGDRRNDAALQERTQQLIRVVSGDASFDDFAAFDLCIDDSTEAIIAGTSDAISATNLVDARLTCVSQLMVLNPNPEIVERLLRDATRLLGELERTNAWPQLASQLTALQRTATVFRESRAEVSAAIVSTIESFFTPSRFGRLLTMYEAGGEDRVVANAIIAACGPSLTGAVLRSVQDASRDKRILQLVCDHAVTFAPAIAGTLDELTIPQRVAAIQALGAAGRGFEPYISRQLAHPSEVVVREALRALGRIASDDAAEMVTRFVLRQGTSGAVAAEDVIWQFSPIATHHCLRSLLRQRQFVVDNPGFTLRLLQRTDRFEPSKLSDVLTPLKSLRFRFWNRPLAQIGRRAAELLPT
jgi:hypothetical protein